MTHLTFRSAIAQASYPGFSLEECGDAHVIEPFDTGLLVAGIDGLGHGLKAAHAAVAAANALRQYPSRPASWLLEHCNESIRGTRGAAVSLVSINAALKQLEWAGVGNVTGTIIRANATTRKSETLLAQGGVVGFRMPRLRAVTLPIHAYDTLILTTDGIRSGFLEDLPNQQDPQHTADYVLNNYKRDTDDALVVVCSFLPM